jgi:DNA-directed RNA polymerase subunit H (RpoH/RPB5)
MARCLYTGQMDLKHTMQQNIYKMFVERGDDGVHIELVSDMCMVQTEKHAVFYFGNNMSVKDARDLVSKISDFPSHRRVVAIVQGSVTSQAKHMLNETDIQVFKSTSFHYSPIEHEFVPKHTLLTRSEKLELLKKVPAHQLPKILKDDVIAMFYGAIIGDVFRIERVNNIYYRIVGS